MAATLGREAPGSLSGPEWDVCVQASPEGNVLQSYGWGEVKDRHGWEVQRFVLRDGDATAAAQVLWRKTLLGSMGYIARGPVVSPGHEALTARLLDEVHAEAKTRKALFLKVEPQSSHPGVLPSLGFRRSAHTVQPSATLMIDLRDDVDTLMDRLHAKTRYNVRLAEKRGVRVFGGGAGDMDAFAAIMRETGTRDRFGVRSPAYYRDVLELLGGHAELLLAEHEGDLLGGLLLTKFNGVQTFLFGGSTSRKRNLMASHLLQWEAVRRAKEQGLREYDLWAVPAELGSEAQDEAAVSRRADELPPARGGGGLWGVYRFKRGFGGRLVRYAGAYDYVYDRVRYSMWNRVLPYALAFVRRRSAAELN